jgi:hypothetical protein
MLVPDRKDARERRLIKHFRALDASERETLESFAEFLVKRRRSDESARESATGQSEVAAHEPRPAQESVIAAIKRLRRNYPQLDASELLNEVSLLTSSHMLQGRPAGEVIDELEELFARHARERA